MRRKGVSYAKYGYYFTLPFLIAFLVFSLYPTLYTMFIGFTDMRGVIPDTPKVLDNPFQNYNDLLFNNKSFVNSLKNTGIMWVLNFIPQVVLALLLTAWFTNTTLRIKGQGAFKVLLYMPNIITAGTIAVLFNALFAYPMGPINNLLETLGVIEAPVNFLQDKDTARGIIAFVQFWMWYGNTMIVLIAGVMGINPALYEAATIDGANSVQTFFKITLPSLKTILIYVFITSLIGGLQMFDIPQLFLAGGPDNATQTASVFIYNLAFRGTYLHNVAAAASMIVFLIALVVSIAFFFLMRDKDAIQTKKAEKAQRKAEKLAGRGVQ